MLRWKARVTHRDPTFKAPEESASAGVSVRKEKTRSAASSVKNGSQRLFSGTGTDTGTDTDTDTDTDTSSGHFF
jgi:hypothetical protein